MAYHTLLAHIRNESTAHAVLDVALMLADQQDAHLTGLHVVPPPEALTTYPLPASMTEQLMMQQRDLTKRLAGLFEERTAATRFVSDWRVIDEPSMVVEQALLEHGRMADAVILGLERDADHRGSRAELTSRLLTGTGRPILLVPPEGKHKSVGNRIFVAWDGQRAATRAVFDAIPMLQWADRVRLQRINPPTSDRHHVLGSVDELANTLSRHDVNVEVFTADARVTRMGEELLGFATDWGADTLVMGGFGHGAVRDFFLGSATAYMLQHATVPMLMSN